VADHSSSPLSGKRVLITRAESQSAGLIDLLHAQGAEVISLPLIRIAPLDDFSQLDFALRNLANFDWLIFTSQNAVTAVADRLAALAIHSSQPSGPLCVAAVGKSTAAAAAAAGFSVTHVGSSNASDLVRELTKDLYGKRIFLPRSDRAAAALIAQLKELAAIVTEVIAYRTIGLDSVDENDRELILQADAILFFSPSVVRAFLDLTKSGVLSSVRADAAVGAIGPVTYAAVVESGLRCDFQAPEPGASEIVAALAAHFGKASVSSVSGGNSR